MKRRIACLILAAGFMGPSILVAQPSKASLSGTWALVVESVNRKATPTVTLKQDGSTLIGHYSGELFGEAALKGMVKGTSVSFTVFAKWQGERQDLSFTGNYDGNRTITGTYSTDFGDGTFVATRK